MPLKLVYRNQPIATLITILVAWKSFLLLVAKFCPGPSYDTSTSLLLTSQNGSLFNGAGLTEKLTRWDAIYFTKVAGRGYLFEQEWAWGWGWTRLISLVAYGLRSVGIGQHDDLEIESLAGIFIAHLSHGLSVLVLYHLTDLIFTPSKRLPLEGKRLAFITACLHIISPAGMFLSAPYAESTFSLLSFSGYYLFIHSSEGGTSSVRKEVSLLLAGLLFGMSVTVRSNGILNGILFLEEAVRALLSFKVKRLLAAGVGGALVGVGFLLPQVIAYQHFCGSTDEVIIRREWCTRMIPSIYSFVQSHYWDVGLFRYWTVSNIPLFLLAAPMFAILSLSSIWGMTAQSNPLGTNTASKQPEKSQPIRTLKIMALIQAILGLFTLVNAHVQIVTRIASAYPVWYWWASSKVMEPRGSKSDGESSRWVVRWMIMYAVIQGGLFASFLPPA